jgi:hypothetical protein
MHGTGGCTRYYNVRHERRQVSIGFPGDITADHERTRRFDDDPHMPHAPCAPSSHLRSWPAVFLSAEGDKTLKVAQSGIFALGTSSHSYLEFDLHAGSNSLTLVQLIASLGEPA